MTFAVNGRTYKSPARSVVAICPAEGVVEAKSMLPVKIISLPW